MDRTASAEHQPRRCFCQSLYSWNVVFRATCHVDSWFLNSQLGNTGLFFRSILWFLVDVDGGLLGARPAHLRREPRAWRSDNRGFPGASMLLLFLTVVVCGWPFWPTLLACWDKPLKTVTDIKHTPYHSMLRWEVVASTWARDSHDLFDFEASQLQTCLACSAFSGSGIRYFSCSSHSPRIWFAVTFPHGEVLPPGCGCTPGLCTAGSISTSLLRPSLSALVLMPCP